MPGDPRGLVLSRIGWKGAENCNRKKRRKVKPGRWIYTVVVKEYFAHPSQQDGGGVWKSNVCNLLDYVLDSLQERSERRQFSTKK